MQIKAKIYSLLLILGASLLLGGNVSAAGSSISINDASALVQQLQQKVNDLTIQLQINRNIPTVTISVAPVLTQEKLDNIQSQVNIVAGEIARLKIEVGIFVTLRQIRQKTAELNAQIAQGDAGTAGQAANSGQLRQRDGGTIESQIAKVKQQISELNQELAIQQAKGQGAVASTDTASGICQGNSCSATSADQNKSQSAVTIVPQTAPASKGFWQSIGDFFKKLFTF